MNLTPVPWDKRADRWFDDHPGLKLVLDGPTIVALGVLFGIAILALAP